MKTRQGFVSNSSSTSFIIDAGEVDEIKKKYNIECYKVQDIIKTFDAVRKSYSKNLPDFIYEEVSWAALNLPYYHELIDLDKERPGCYITESYDRDHAFENGLSRYSAFETDL